MSVYDGVQLAYDRRIFASRYNKAEALECYIAENNVNPGLIAFVDDNSNNVMNVFLHFAETNLDILSFWYTPPSTGKDEKYEEIYRQLLLAIANSDN